MFWNKKYKCEKCGKEYKGTHHLIEDEQGNEVTICNECSEKLINDDLREYEEEEKEFENKKKSMKYLYKEFFRGNFLEGNKELEEINLDINIYSDKKLTKKERENITKSNNQKLLLLKEQILSLEKGNIVLKGEINLMPTINLDKGEKLKENQKPKKKIIIEIVKS